MNGVNDVMSSSNVSKVPRGYMVLTKFRKDHKKGLDIVIEKLSEKNIKYKTNTEGSDGYMELYVNKKEYNSYLNSLTSVTRSK